MLFFRDIHLSCVPKYCKRNIRTSCCSSHATPEEVSKFNLYRCWEHKVLGGVYWSKFTRACTFVTSWPCEKGKYNTFTSKAHCRYCNLPELDLKSPMMAAEVRKERKEKSGWQAWIISTARDIGCQPVSMSSRVKGTNWIVDFQKVDI